MNISLTKELEALVLQKVRSGRYLSASEVVREALRLLEERDRLNEARLKELRSEIRQGLHSGSAIPAERVFSELRTRSNKRAKRA